MEKPPVAFRALQLAVEQRTIYGLRYNDWARYRKHCANRTHRLRSTLKMTHGKGREFKKLPAITPANVREGHLQLLLMEAERAWAYSQDLIIQSQKSADGASALRRTATGRFRRAVHWSTQLLSLCQALHQSSRLTASHLLEVETYVLVLNARLLRYRDDFEDALAQFSVALSLLKEMEENATTSHDQALATLIGDEIRPEIRYCAHELGRSKSYDIDGIVAEVAGKHQNQLVKGCDKLLADLKSGGQGGSRAQGRKLKTLTWEDEPVPIRNPELVGVLLKVQEGVEKLDATRGQEKISAGKGPGKSKRGVAAYDAVLSALSDAEDVARKLAEAQSATDAGAGVMAAGSRDIHFVHAFVVYQLLSRRTERDLLLVATLLSSEETAPGKDTSGAKRKAQVDSRLYPAVVKLLDTIVQSLEQMRTLSIVDESPDLASCVEAKIAYTKARRCLFLSRCYAPLNQFAEALSLLQRGTIHLREARAVLETVDEDPATFYALDNSALEALDSTLTAESLAYKIQWLAYNGGSIDADAKTHKKPLFFDIALNYAQLDMDRLQERAGQTRAAVSNSEQVRVRESVRPAVPKAKVEEEARPETPEPQAAPAKGGLSSLLSGWWSR